MRASMIRIFKVLYIAIINLIKRTSKGHFVLFPLKLKRVLTYKDDVMVYNNFIRQWAYNTSIMFQPSCRMM